jgi:hypothetical protein
MPTRFNQDGSLTDGIYDDLKTHCRERYVDGILKNTLSHLWIHTNDPDARAKLTEDWMTPPFGHFPDLPARRKDRQ